MIESIANGAGVFVDMMLRLPPVVGILASWSLTQLHKWIIPPRALADYTDAERSRRTKLVAFVIGAVFTVLAWMNPEVRTVASGTLCQVSSLGFAYCLPPLKAYVVAPIVGVMAIISWDWLMHWVEESRPEFYRKYISGKPVRTMLTLTSGQQVIVVTDSKGRFLKLREVVGDDDLTVTLPPAEPDSEKTEPIR